MAKSRPDPSWLRPRPGSSRSIFISQPYLYKSICDYDLNSLKKLPPACYIFPFSDGMQEKWRHFFQILNNKFLYNSHNCKLHNIYTCAIMQSTVLVGILTNRRRIWTSEVPIISQMVPLSFPYSAFFQSKCVFNLHWKCNKMLQNNRCTHIISLTNNNNTCICRANINQV